MSDWKLLTNHAIALICLTRDPDLTLRQLGDCVGVTERAAHQIVSELAQEGYLVRRREGRRNRYRLRPEAHVEDPVLGSIRVGEVLELLGGDAPLHAG